MSDLFKKKISNSKFKILVLFDETEKENFQIDMEYAAVKDIGDAFLSL